MLPLGGTRPVPVWTDSPTSVGPYLTVLTNFSPKLQVPFVFFLSSRLYNLENLHLSYPQLLINPRLPLKFLLAHSATTPYIDSSARPTSSSTFTKPYHLYW